MNGIDNSDTIAAIATPPGEGGIAVIRVSGANCFDIADRVFSCRAPFPGSRPHGTFVWGRIISESHVVDEALCLIMRAPRSFTGEDTVEFQCHGGAVLARKVLQATLNAGARLAYPGEFSRRAFLNGKIDLLQAEAVADAIRARTDRAAMAAIEQLEGVLSGRINSIYDEILRIAADFQATLDFPEDELPETVMTGISTSLHVAIAEIEKMLATWEEGHLLRDGATVVIAGRPNAGKSTLMNALLGKDRAIVSHYPGTTRDTIEESLVLEGIPVKLVDTAGLRDSTCEIEQEGIRRSRLQVERADLVVYVIDGSLHPHPDDSAFTENMEATKLIVVLSKADLGLVCPRKWKKFTTSTYSINNEFGADEIRGEIASALLSKIPPRDSCAAISERHRRLLLSSLNHLKEATRLAETRDDLESVPAAMLLTNALEDIGRVTGRTYEEDLLDSIFSRFCIGK